MSTKQEKAFYETKNFEVCVPEYPHISREDGGHIFIRSKRLIKDRTEMTENEAIEFIKLSINVGKAYTEVMNANGINIGKINYQENGNWAYLRNETPIFHLHIYGRAKDSKEQIFGEALNLPNMRQVQTKRKTQITKKDIQDLKRKLKTLEGEENE